MKCSKPLSVGTLIMLVTLLLTSCITIYEKSSPKDSTQDPMVGEWQMTRLGITPALPIPDIIINQLISDKATWKLVRQGGQLTIKYDGRDTWYKSIIGLQIDRKPTTAVEDASRTSCNFAGGGSINLEKLPVILSAISPQKIEQISVSFDDKVQLKLASASKLTATINVMVNGKYYGETEYGGSMKWKTLQQNITITYEGTRK